MIRGIPAVFVAVFVITGQSFGQSQVTSPEQVPPPAKIEPAPATPNASQMPGDEGNSRKFGFRPFDCAADSTCADNGFWANADILLGWVKGDHLPPLVTTSPAGTAATAAGVLGQPGTSVLFGNNSVNTDLRFGFRTQAGYWFTPKRELGVEAGFFLLEDSTDTFFATSNGTPILARPFTNVTANNAQASHLVAFPGTSTGSVAVTGTSSETYGWNIDFRENFIRCPWYSVDVLLGYRSVRYDEGLLIQENVQPQGGTFAAGTQILSHDIFTTRNVFNGGDFGLRAQVRYDAWTVDLLGKLAVGSTHRSADIGGSTTTTVPNQTPVTNTGGLLALSSNIGNHNKFDWTTVPEFGVTLGWQMSQTMRLQLGYSALWWDKVARPGDAIDLGVNPSLIPPSMRTAGSPNRPAFSDRRTELFVESLTLGLEIRY